MNPCFHLVYGKFLPYHLNVEAEIKIHQIRQGLSNHLLSIFGEHMQIVASEVKIFTQRNATNWMFQCKTLR